MEAERRSLQRQTRCRLHKPTVMPVHGESNRSGDIAAVTCDLARGGSRAVQFDGGSVVRLVLTDSPRAGRARRRPPLADRVDS